METRPASQAVLRRVGLFEGLDEEALDRIAEVGFRRRLDAGAFLFFQDTPARSAYVVLEGRLRIVQATPEGERVVVRYMQAGDVVGLIAALGDMEYPVTAEVAEDGTVVLGWSGETLRSLMETYPRLALNAMTHMAGMVRDLLRRVRELSTERVERRIARTLLRLARHAGRRVEAGVEIAFPITREEIAQMAGTTLYTVSRTLSRWEREGLLETGREHIVIRATHALVAIADDLPPTRGPSPPSAPLPE
ncbi:Fumarate and nitrate reduction regulatory protein [bacterium HR11]|nr:Fumarate and nitrate reduction regulatory protein [bacterium HR11]